MAFKQQMDICGSSKASDIACDLFVLKSYPSLYNGGKTTTSRSGGQATERALCKHLLQNHCESQLARMKKNSKRQLYVVRGCLYKTANQLSTADAVNKGCIPPSKIPVHSSHELKLSISHTLLKKNMHVLILSSFLGLSLSLKDLL